MSKKNKSYVTIDVTLKVEMSEDCLEAFGINRMTRGDFYLNQGKFEQKCIRAMFRNNPRELITADVKSAYFGKWPHNEQTFNEMRHAKAQKAQKQFAKEVTQ